MGLIANLLKRKSVPDDKVDSSLQMLDRLKQVRGDETGRYLSLMIDPRAIPPPAAPPTMEDLEQREDPQSVTYSPPMESVVYQHPEFLEPEKAGQNIIEAGINLFFDEFARQASAHNASVTDSALTVFINRPSYTGEKFPAGGDPVFSACLHIADWGIYFFGHGGSIDVYLLPYDHEELVKFADVHEDGCKPFLAVTTREGGSGLEWYVDGLRFTRDHIPELARKLLSDLVHAAASESKP